MRITCPNCSSSYTLRNNLVGPEGRKVKCASCAHIWLVLPESATPPLAAEPVAVPVPALAEADQADASVESNPPDAVENAAVQIDDAPPEDEASFSEAVVPSGPVGSAPAPAVDRSPRKTKKAAAQDKKRRRRVPTRFLLTAAGLVLLCLMVPLRDQLVTIAPDLGRLYELVGLDVNTRSVEFSTLQPHRRMVAGLPVLEVTGEMTNIGSSEVALGPLRLALLGPGEQEIFVWRLDPPAERLPAGQTLAFETDITAPPANAVGVSVRFLQNGERMPARAR